MCGRQVGRWQLDSKTGKVYSLSLGQGSLVNEDKITIILQEMLHILFWKRKKQRRSTGMSMITTSQELHW